MYKLHLILKYLRKRRIAWVSLIAVMLCTTMVIVVISVMGGWLRMFRESFHGLSGDIIVQSRTVVGFPHYEEMIQRIEQVKGVKAAVPTIQTYGLIDIRNYVYEIAEAVQVVGYPIERIGDVNKFPQSLHRQWEVRRQVYEQGLRDESLSPEQREKIRQMLAEPPPPSFDLLPNVNYEREARRAAEKQDVRKWPGMIVGAALVGVRKNSEGEIERPDTLYEAWARLQLLSVEPETKTIDETSMSDAYYWIVDDSRTQIYQQDKSTVYVPFDELQKQLRMEAYEGDPARTSTIEIAVHEGVDMYAVLPEIQRIVDEVFDAHGKLGYPVLVQTWEQSQATWLGAVEKEKSLVTILFGIISIVAIFLIFCIFYMIVVEKTKDIGIIKSVGATGGGVAGIFLGYGLAIGIVGGGLGLLAGYLIVHYINELHAWMAELTGAPIWDPAVYAFDIIPNTLDPREVTVIVAVAIVSSVLGSLVPAIRAARMHPVEALRWE